MTPVSSQGASQPSPLNLDVTCMGAPSASLAWSPGSTRPDAPQAAGYVRMEVCMEQFTGQHPAIKDVLPGQQIDTLVAQARYYLQGPSDPVVSQSIKFAYAAQPYGAGTIPDATATVTPDEVNAAAGAQHGESGQTLVSGKGFVAAEVTGASPISPDYGLAYIACYETNTASPPPFSPQCAPWAALFTIRVWHDATARLAYIFGDKLTTAPNRNFSATLSLATTDSVGSTHAVEGMQVVFDITSGGATFDPSGVTTRYCEITNAGLRAIVISQQGVAIAPPIKAGPTVGAIAVRASSPFSQDTVPYALSIV
ncbi:hypothetical protein CAL29_01040 [Bordetella genomosp. 10]|uniref:Uncharacterized protein n=1 Tax=Bordetella genomosp. 10 TaxID=1416804 RepID=A0A261SI40_9BORD|nr:hypothetical protein [Bordetella genomosp. 10]OZI37054.1 hypothetical protein CAL29_01040 [Bordetella genomosp. 10]